MIKKIVSLMMTLALACFMAAPVFAGEREGAISLSPFIGGYTFDGIQQLETAPVFGLRLGYDITGNWGVEAVADYLSTTATHSERSSNALSYRLDVLYNFNPVGPLVPYLALGGGGITYGHGMKMKPWNDNVDATFNAGGGLKYFLTDSMALRGDARQLLVFGQQTMFNWEYTAGLTFLFDLPKPAPPQVCPPVPPPPPAPVKVEAPAPPPPPPPAPTCNLTVNPGSIKKGRSAMLSWTSQNATNCDIRPNIGPVKTEGTTTITPDADTDYALTCTGPGGSANSAAKILVVAPEMLCYTIDIEFDTAKWDIKPQYHDELVKLANFMKDYPELNGVIEGHTDNKAGYQYNMQLSDKRAKSVRDYLVTKLGIDGARLTSKGFGYTKPIATNKTDEGRQKNRRVVANFKCVEKK